MRAINERGPRARTLLRLCSEIADSKTYSAGEKLVAVESKLFTA